MAILAPEQGSRALPPIHPTVPSGGGIFQGVLSQPWLAGGAAAIGVANFLRSQQAAAAAAAAAKAIADRARDSTLNRILPIAVLPRDVPPPLSIPRIPLLPPLAPLPAPPSLPGGVAPAAAGGGMMLLLVAATLLLSFRRR